MVGTVTGLLDFVEQDDAIGPAPDGFGEQPRNTRTTRKGHGSSGECQSCFAERQTKSLCRERETPVSAFAYFACFAVPPNGAGEFGFADAGGAEEDERADGARRGG
jgi:hypothetical protein